MLASTTLGLIIGLVVLIAASISDVKTREVPDWLSYSFLAFVLGNAVLSSIFYSYSYIIINTLIGLAVGLGIGYAMFYTGQWGGGDSKLIFGLFALIGMNVSEFQSGLPTLILFAINILLAGAIIGLIYSIFKSLSNFESFKREARKKLRGKRIFWVRVVLLVVCTGSFVYFLASRSLESMTIFIFSMASFFFFYMWVLISAVEKACMIKEVPVKDLEEGDWIVNPVYKNRKRILKPTLTGATLNQINILKRNKINKVTIKIGMPFVPSFLAAYIATYALGNWLIFII